MKYIISFNKMNQDPAG